MSENEKTLRKSLNTHQMRIFDALLAEHRAEAETLRRNLADAQKDAAENAEALASAREAALEEAAEACKGHLANAEVFAKRIRALKSRPAERLLPESKVRGCCAT